MDVTRNDVERMIDASLGATPAPTLGQVEEFVRKTLDYDFATTLTEPFSPGRQAAGQRHFLSAGRDDP